MALRQGLAHWSWGWKARLFLPPLHRYIDTLAHGQRQQFKVARFFDVLFAKDCRLGSILPTMQQPDAWRLLGLGWSYLRRRQAGTDPGCWYHIRLTHSHGQATLSLLTHVLQPLPTYSLDKYTHTTCESPLSYLATASPDGKNFLWKNMPPWPPLYRRH